MAIYVEVDNYQPRRSRKNVPYIGFNIRVRTDEGVGFVSCDWRLQGGLLYPPYKVSGPGRFFTTTFVSEPVARLIYRQALADLKILAETNPELASTEEKNGWRSAVYSDTLLRNILPTVIEEEGGLDEPKVEGRMRKVWSKTKDVAEPEPEPAKPALVKQFTAEEEVENWDDPGYMIRRGRESAERRKAN